MKEVSRTVASEKCACAFWPFSSEAGRRSPMAGRGLRPSMTFSSENAWSAVAWFQCHALCLRDVDNRQKVPAAITAMLSATVSVGVRKGIQVSNHPLESAASDRRAASVDDVLVGVSEKKVIRDLSRGLAWMRLIGTSRCQPAGASPPPASLPGIVGVVSACISCRIIVQDGEGILEVTVTRRRWRDPWQWLPGKLVEHEVVHREVLAGEGIGRSGIAGVSSAKIRSRVPDYNIV
jgi:hypothetical protein